MKAEELKKLPGTVKAGFFFKRNFRTTRKGRTTRARIDRG